MTRPNESSIADSSIAGPCVPGAAERQRIVDAAVDLFYRNGCHATTLSHIAECSGLPLHTVRSAFESREALILAAFRQRDVQFRGMLDDWLDRCQSDGRDRLLAIFDFLSIWYEGPGFHGCMFINATAEFADPEAPVHRAASAHKTALYDRIHELTADAFPEQAGTLSRQLVLLMEGAIVTAQVTGNLEIARHARAAATVLLDQTALSQRTG